MTRACLMLLALTLAGCTAAKPAPRPAVVILGNKTTPAQCECPDAAAARAETAKWKAYAEKLETALGLPHEGQP